MLAAHGAREVAQPREHRHRHLLIARDQEVTVRIHDVAGEDHPGPQVGERKRLESVLGARRQHRGQGVEHRGVVRPVAVAQVVERIELRHSGELQRVGVERELEDARTDRDVAPRPSVRGHAVAVEALVLVRDQLGDVAQSGDARDDAAAGQWVRHVRLAVDRGERDPAIRALEHLVRDRERADLREQGRDLDLPRALDADRVGNLSNQPSHP
ncbi:MAG: hypothetical protein O3B31_04220 [Chloroflexi bacterium]|nr:hypothetical protein [Chloroflexota bacterium]